MLERDHSRFTELASLAAIGQISSSEHSELSAHVAECDECRRAYLDYSRIVRIELPQATPARRRMKQAFLHPGPESEVRDRFFARARAEGIELSAIAERTSNYQSRGNQSAEWSWRWSQIAVAITAVAAAIVIGVVLWPRVPVQPLPIQAVTSPLAPMAAENQQLRAQVSDLEARVAASQRSSEVAQRDPAELKRIHELEVELASARAQLQAEQTTLASALQDKYALESGHDRDAASLAQQRSENQRLRDQFNNLVAGVAESQERIRTLNATLAEAHERSEMEKQLAGVSSDVRQLMGARNLHIIDVHDVNGAGQSARSFGRVFYAEGQSMVFYAFDLPNGKLTPAKYHFQAWGQMEGQSASIRNLGTFSVDDHEQRRWVLKVSDARLLTGIDSLFVTAESTRDAIEPRGSRILYAYLAGKANHP